MILMIVGNIRSFLFLTEECMKTKIEKEKATVELMIRLYCRHIEGNTNLCASCRSLLTYAHARLDRCRYGDGKPACSRCLVHCYKPEMRDRIRLVMRTMGPRMFFYAPLAALKHLLGK